MAIPGYSKTAAQLTAITAANRDEGHSYQVRDKGGAWFWFDPASSAAAGPSVLVPDDNPTTGRWVPAGGGNSSGGGSISIGSSKPVTTPAAVGEMVAVNGVTTPTALIGGITPVVVTVTRRSIWVATGTSSAADWKRFGPADIEVIVPTSYTGTIGNYDLSPDVLGIDPEYLGQRYWVGHPRLSTFATNSWEFVGVYNTSATSAGTLYTWAYVAH